RHRQMKDFTRLALIGLAFAFVLLIGWFIKHINGPRVVARAVAPDGTEMCIVQKCNWGGEPFTTSFYYRKPGGPWGWFYYDQQDRYWGVRHRQIAATRNSGARAAQGKRFFFVDADTIISPGVLA